MKYKLKLTIVLIFALLLITFACTSGDNATKNTNTTANSANAATDKQTYKSVGVIKRIDAENGRITIDHEDIPGYMAAMEMNEPVMDKSLFNNLKAGDKVDFEIERTGAKVVVTKINKIGSRISYWHGYF